MNVVYAVAIIALVAVSAAVFFDYLLHDRYVAWWQQAKTGIQQGLEGFYQERGW